ncbi:hypothetical protein PFISCL1PPCAC_6458, partial [Pristionchus fissidentatus]
FSVPLCLRPQAAEGLREWEEGMDTVPLCDLPQAAGRLRERKEEMDTATKSPLPPSITRCSQCDNRRTREKNLRVSTRRSPSSIPLIGKIYTTTPCR